MPPVVIRPPRMAEKIFLPALSIPLVTKVGVELAPPRCQGGRSHKEVQKILQPRRVLKLTTITTIREATTKSVQVNNLC